MRARTEPDRQISLGVHVSGRPRSQRSHIATAFGLSPPWDSNPAYSLQRTYLRALISWKRSIEESRSIFDTRTQHFAVLGPGERGCELWPAVERVGALAGLGLDELGDDRDPLDFGEPLDRRALRLDPEPGALLLPCGDTVAAPGTARSSGRTPPIVAGKTHSARKSIGLARPPSNEGGRRCSRSL
jgi:hypothetical protein